MKCPVCNDVNLLMTDRQGIEIDYCPQCRGVWLDRGELDRLIERAGREAAPLVPERPEPVRDPRDDYVHASIPPDDRYRRKRKSWLGDILDFD